MLGAGAGDANGVRFLKGVIADHERWNLTGQNDNRNRETLDSTFSVAEEFDEGSIELFVDETRLQNSKLAKQEVWLIGSSRECDLVIKNQFVSRKHCLLFKNGSQFELEDWASTNGTYVNHERLPPRMRTRISNTDIVTLGERTLMPWPPVSD